MDDVKLDAKQIRRRLNWSQKQLAEYLGVDQSSVSRLERGQEPAGPVRKLLELLSQEKGAA